MRTHLLFAALISTVVHALPQQVLTSVCMPSSRAFALESKLQSCTDINFALYRIAFCKAAVRSPIQALHGSCQHSCMCNWDLVGLPAVAYGFVICGDVCYAGYQRCRQHVLWHCETTQKAPLPSVGGPTSHKRNLGPAVPTLLLSASF